MTMRPVGEQQLIGSSLRCFGEAQPFEEAFALREVDRVVAHRFGVELSDGEVRRKATGDGIGLKLCGTGEPGRAGRGGSCIWVWMPSPARSWLRA
jgi:hypothetical protein